MDLSAINPVLFVAGFLVAATPLIFAAIGELVVEKSGTLNLGGQVEMEVDAVGGDTRIGRLMQLVERYASRPARMVQPAGIIGGGFTSASATHESGSPAASAHAAS